MQNRVAARKEQLRLRTFDRFSDLSPCVAGQLLIHLGLEGGWMRPRAMRYDPHVVVAFEHNYRITDGPDDGELESIGYWLPVGWLALFEAGAWANTWPQVAVYVLEGYRKRGIGTKLVQRAITRWKLDRVGVQISCDNKGVEDFYRKAGIE